MYGPLIKYGIMIALAVSLCVGLIAYGSHRKQLEWDASIAKQAIESASQVIAQAVNTAKVEVRYIEKQAKTKIVTQTIEKEVIRYVDSPAKKCELSPEFEHAFDAVGGMLNASTNRLPSPDSPARIALESVETTGTGTEVIPSL